MEFELALVFGVGGDVKRVVITVHEPVSVTVGANKEEIEELKRRTFDIIHGVLPDLGEGCDGVGGGGSGEVSEDKKDK